MLQEGRKEEWREVEWVGGKKRKGGKPIAKGFREGKRGGEEEERKGEGPEKGNMQGARDVQRKMGTKWHMGKERKSPKR